ncbi:uncharacterized protein LOC111778157 isoform X3 [Cucurbita pepo subsp. pepo]|uniref:uncharacterized protein LOC111778157 isoform X3 n=1 Tax=Cucurbita pepo subsp. pepo TaxID=3664 RepID=UPI000C9D9420|nr:uncharacterized protein LOC111778157 isoform X3 [Cucurbita pepo subsp. pepo]
MRLRKGDQVEVYSQEEVSSGSWSCAEIVSGNGRTYSVRYFQTEEAVEKVPRWAIRPCPPPVEGPNVWAAGDLAEAFHNSSWKQARIMQIIGVNCYLARLLGSPLDVLVSQSYLRLRQAWRDGQWFLLGKAFEDLGSLPGNKQTVPDMVKSKVQQLVTALPTRHQRRPLLEKSKKHTVSILKRKITKKDVTYLPSLAKTTKLCLTRELSRVRLSSTFPAVNTEVATGYVGLREDNLIPRTSNYIHTVSCASSVGSNNSTDDFFKEEDMRKKIHAPMRKYRLDSTAYALHLRKIWVPSLVMTWNNLEALRAFSRRWLWIILGSFFHVDHHGISHPNSCKYAYGKPFDE